MPLRLRYKKHMSLRSNVVPFPKTSNQKLQDAIDCFSSESASIALDKFIRLIDEGINESYVFVGAIFEFGGKDVEKDYDKARFYYEQSIERFGAVEAYLGLARIYYHGLGIEPDYCKALEYCEIVAEESDNMYANFMIGKIHMDGLCVEQDLDKAKTYFKRSSDSGYVFGMTYLGLLEQNMGNRIRGWFYRMKAGIIAFFIARKDINSPRIREI